MALGGREIDHLIIRRLGRINGSRFDKCFLITARDHLERTQRHNISRHRGHIRRRNRRSLCDRFRIRGRCCSRQRFHLLQTRDVNDTKAAIAFKAAFTIMRRQSAQSHRKSRIGIFNGPENFQSAPCFATQQRIAQSIFGIEI